MPEDPRPMTEAEMLAHCRAAIARIDRHGVRGASLVTMEETVALALMVACLSGGAVRAQEGAA